MIESYMQQICFKKGSDPQLQLQFKNATPVVQKDLIIKTSEGSTYFAGFFGIKLISRLSSAGYMPESYTPPQECYSITTFISHRLAMFLEP